MKKRISLLMVGALCAAMLAGCAQTADYGNGEDGQNNGSDPAAMTGEITVVSREDGSGTRGAFIELMGIEQKDADGNKVDKTTVEAIITNKTDVMMTTVAGDDAAIGYISLGSLDKNVKAVKVDGVEATTANVKNGTYKVSRPFNIVTKGQPEGLAADFINFIMSKEGQTVANDAGYIAVNDAAEAFTSDGSAGKIVVGGSSSVSPLMEKLIEAYQKINAGAEIELQTTDSTSGVTSTKDGTYDIGMASRDLKDSEKGDVEASAIALDGIAVIVNNNNPVDVLTSEQIMKIFTGELTDWSDVQ